MTILAAVTLLLGAASSARGGFIDELRESVELSKEQDAGAAAAATSPPAQKPKGTPRPKRDAKPSAASGAKGGSRGTGTKRTRGTGDRK